MALIKCPECAGQVSTEAAACPSCGYPIAAKNQPQSVHNDALLLEVRPSWWNYFWHLAFAWLIVPAVIAWRRRRAEVVHVYGDRVTIQRGVFTRSSRALFIRDIRSIDVDQSLWGRILGVGNLTISTAATVDADEELHGVPNPQAIRDLIIARRQTP